MCTSRKKFFTIDRRGALLHVRSSLQRTRKCIKQKKNRIRMQSILIEIQTNFDKRLFVAYIR